MTTATETQTNDPQQYSILIGGKPVAYLKRVTYGEPYVIFAQDDPNYRTAKYSERVAKGWLNTCRKYFADVEMVPVDRVS